VHHRGLTGTHARPGGDGNAPSAGTRHGWGRPMSTRGAPIAVPA
jgi:hypothetical protein